MSVFNKLMPVAVAGADSVPLDIAPDPAAPPPIDPNQLQQQILSQLLYTHV
jgi:hypothetical protein